MFDLPLLISKESCTSSSSRAGINRKTGVPAARSVRSRFLKYTSVSFTISRAHKLQNIFVLAASKLMQTAYAEAIVTLSRRFLKNA